MPRRSAEGGRGAAAVEGRDVHIRERHVELPDWARDREQPPHGRRPRLSSSPPWPARSSAGRPSWCWRRRRGGRLAGPGATPCPCRPAAPARAGRVAHPAAAARPTRPRRRRTGSSHLPVATGAAGGRGRAARRSGGACGGTLGMVPWPPTGGRDPRAAGHTIKGPEAPSRPCRWRRTRLPARRRRARDRQRRRRSSTRAAAGSWCSCSPPKASASSTPTTPSTPIPARCGRSTATSSWSAASTTEATALQRQGELGIWASLLGQEAAQIGSGRALAPQDYVFPTYREHGVAWCRGVDPVTLLGLFRGVNLGGWDPRRAQLPPLHDRDRRPDPARHRLRDGHPARRRGGHRRRRPRRRGDRLLRRRRDGAGRRQRGVRLRQRLQRPGRVLLPEQPVGDLGAERAADPHPALPARQRASASPGCGSTATTCSPSTP